LNDVQEYIQKHKQYQLNNKWTKGGESVSLNKITTKGLVVCTVSANWEEKGNCTMSSCYLFHI